MSTMTVRGLRARLEEYERRRARQAGWVRGFIPTGLASLDAVLPHGGLPRGAVTEILAAGPGLGSLSLALRLASEGGNREQETGNREQGTGNRERIIFVDRCGDFYPPAAGGWGIDLDRLIVVGASCAQDAFWAVDQALRCPAVSAVVASFVRLDERCSRRLQLAAESSGGRAFLLMPARSERGTERAAGFSPRGFSSEGTEGRRDEGTERKRHETTEPRSREAAEGKNVERRNGSRSLISCSLFPVPRSLPPSLRPSVPPSLLPLPCSLFPAPYSLSFAAVRLLVEGVPREAQAGGGYPCRITLLKVREGMPGKSVLVDLHHETGALPVYALPGDRSAAKTG